LRWQAAREGFGFRVSDFFRISDFGFRICLLSTLLLSVAAPVCAATNAIPAAPGVPDVTFSLLRIFGALLLVLAVFFGGVWMFRNWQRSAGHAGRPSKLQVLEMRSLGNRNAVFVVGYEQQRLLVAASPAGVTLLDHLPPATVEEAQAVAGPVSFAETLRKCLPLR
jgi:flagellar biogenesis protein FliO